jgi:hypothetical protein
MTQPSLSPHRVVSFGYKAWVLCLPIVWSKSLLAGGGLSLSFKTVPKSKVHVCIYTIAFELSYSSLC